MDIEGCPNQFHLIGDPNRPSQQTMNEKGEKSSGYGRGGERLMDPLDTRNKSHTAQNENRRGANVDIVMSDRETQFF